MDQSDPEVLRNLNENSSHRKNKDSLQIPPEVIDLCREPENVDPQTRIDLVAEGYDVNELPNLGELPNLIAEGVDVAEFEDHNIIEFDLEFSDPE